MFEYIYIYIYMFIHCIFFLRGGWGGEGNWAARKLSFIAQGLLVCLLFIESAYCETLENMEQKREAYSL